MLGLMQDHPLLISSLIEYAAAYHPEQEIVSRARSRATRCAPTTHRSNAARAWLRSPASACARRPRRHAGSEHAPPPELYFGVSGSGAVLHTVNPRLFPEQIDYIVNHAEDSVLFFDTTFAELVAKLAPKLTTVRHFVALCDRAHMPALDLPNLLCYEDLLAASSGTTSGRSSTSAPPPRCATPRAPPAIRRACSIRTAPRCCTA